MNNKKIKAEIERRLKDLEEIKVQRGWTTAELGDIACCKHLLSFIDSLEEPVSEDLEEAADNYPSAINIISPQWSGEIKNAFKAGAKWQKEQIMKDAFDCKIDWYDGCVLDYTQEQLDNTIEALGLEVNDKIKVIIIKEE